MFASPRVNISETSFDFGIANQGQLVTANFSIKNSGTEPLVIEKIDFSMSGMNVRVKQSIEPGEESQAHFTWDTRRLRQKITGQATLHINDPSMPQIILSLSGTVIPAIEFLPRPAFYLSQFTGESHSQSITLKNNQDHPLEITDLSTMSNNFDFHLKEINAGKVFELTVLVKSDAPAGRYRDSLVIITSDPKHTSLHLEVNILVKSDIFVSVDTIDFGEINTSHIKNNSSIIGFLQQTFAINRKHGEMSIIGYESDIDFLNVEVEPATQSNAFKIEVGLKPRELKKGVFHGSVVLKTNDPDNPELIVPVTGVILD